MELVPVGTSLPTKAYEISARAEKLTFAHHKVIVHDNISKGQRTELLKLAIDGTPNKKGVPTVWSSGIVRVATLIPLFQQSTANIALSSQTR